MHNATAHSNLPVVWVGTIPQPAAGYFAVIPDVSNCITANFNKYPEITTNGYFLKCVIVIDVGQKSLSLRWFGVFFGFRHSSDAAHASGRQGVRDAEPDGRFSISTTLDPPVRSNSRDFRCLRP